MNHKTIFSKNLSLKMKEQDKSRNDICADLGFSYFTVTDWVNGKKMPRMDKVELLANYFGCPISELIEGNQSAENELSIEAKERASRIYKLIVESGRSYKELETITGVTKSCLQRYATGERNIPIIAIEKLATAFNVSKSYLMWGEENQSATMGIGNKIRTARTEKGMSQEELGNPTDATAIKIASYFNVPVSYLMGTEEKQSTEGELSEIQKNFMQKVARMSDDQIVKIEQFLALLG